mmetsp:Transcript_99008/g.178780  ORF Transcript_99008/g.178780 Transcript_99008/m.178780 type:complete len:979 (-) Transcript_99008:249-3185(-)
MSPSNGAIQLPIQVEKPAAPPAAELLRPPRMSAISRESGASSVPGAAVLPKRTSRKDSQASPGGSMPDASPKGSMLKSEEGRVSGVAGKISLRAGTPFWVTCSRNVVDNRWFMLVTTILTIYALTGDDIRIMCTDKPSDFIFNINAVICIVVFSAEVLLSCIGKNDYYLGFFFWLDVISTATLVLDLTWVSEFLEGSSADASNMRSGRTARVGARAARVVRVLRLVRILKLYKAYYEAKQRRAAKEAKERGEETDDWDETDVDDDQEGKGEGRESRVGKKLSEMTTRRVICLILAMLLVLPVLRAEESNLTPFSASYGADVVNQAFSGYLKGSGDKSEYQRALLNYIYYHNWFARAAEDTHCPSRNCNNQYFGQLFWVGITGTSSASLSTNSTTLDLNFIQSFNKNASLHTTEGVLYAYGTMPDFAQEIMASPWTQKCVTSSGTERLGFSLLSELWDHKISYKVPCPENLRSTELQGYSPQLMSDGERQSLSLTFFFDMRPFAKADSGFNLSITFFIMILLIGGSLTFSYDANRLVLQPVEKMIERVEAIRSRPLLAMKMADDEFRVEEMKKVKLEKREKDKVKKFFMDIVAAVCFSNDGAELMETVILEKTIIKLGSLLALGFGEAGADVIGKNMSGSDTAGVNAMVAGRKVECIIGVCRVRSFSTATEVLQSKVMTFGNQIAEIVHGVCNEFNGAPNKNTGETFLVIWKEDAHKTEGIMNRYAESACVAFALVVGSVHRSSLLGTYRGHPGLQNRLGSDCRVHLSCGLHKGWAIEGAVGSEFKIDCSYLSPNVSIATSIERASEIYGVAHVMGQSVVELCSPAMKSKFRLMDKVVLKGSPKPMEIYCVDLDYMALEIDNSKMLGKKVIWNTRQRYKVRQFLEKEKSKLQETDLSKLFDEDPVICMMRKRYASADLFQHFNMGYQNYSQGEWQVARKMLSRETLIDDGPSIALLRFMEVGHGFEAPKGWKGARELSC